MTKRCVYQRLNDDLEWECPEDAVCGKRCEEGLILGKDKENVQPQPVRGRMYAYVDRCDGKGWVKVEEDEI